MAAGSYDRQADLLAFDNTKAGVKGLVDAGIATVPRIFRHSSDDPIDSIPTANQYPTPQIPVIDLLDPDQASVVEEIRRASSEWGFFQVVGHGVPTTVTAGMIEGTRRFYEGDVEVKKELYSRESQKKVKWSCNFDLFRSRAANWRDTMYCTMEPEPPAPEELPSSSREISIEYSRQMVKLGVVLFKLLSKALGLNPTHLIDMECCRGHALLLHYYPQCPEPNLALGTSRHSDPSFLTILLQDQLGGLQVLHNERWVDVSPLPEAFVVNVGDLLQLISNDKFRSVKHRVVANRHGPRISVACFFTMDVSPLSTRPYGPIKELLSEDNPPLYKEVLIRDFIGRYSLRGIGGEALSHYRLDEV